MKIKHLLIGMLAIAGAVACKPDQPVEEPVLEVNKTNVAIAATAGEGAFEVTANNAWTATADADWVSLDPASGNGGEKAVTVKVTAEDNTATEVRTATVTVKAGTLTETLKVTQAAAQGENPGPGEGTLSEWALVGTFGDDNNWNPASELYLSVLDEEYFVYYGLELATNSEFKFLKGGAWPPAGQEIGGNGLVEPNTIQPAGGSNIKVTEAGKYDIYLAADLTKFYIMSEGKLPAEAVEPAPVENTWGMMGCFVDNQWATDVPMTKEGEWIVAKGAQFTELTFKIRANASWADATNIGRAPGSERAVVNGKIEVVTAEYAKANLGGDAADIKLNGEPGTYDVYFSFENLEVYVMEAGFKPGEKEPQNPDPVEITYTVTGTIADNVWSNNAEIGLMAKDGDYLVAKNIPFVWNSTCYGGNYNIIEFKILETGTWDGFAYPEKNVDQYANAEITVQVGGENIALNAPEGNYDVYFDKANLKVWVMEAGFKPGEKEPLIPEEVEPVTEGDIWVNDGTVGAAAWSGSPYRFAKEGMDGLNECCAQIPAAVWEGMKIAPFCVNVKPATAETEWWQIRVLDGWWTNNDESGASDINPQSEGLVNNGDGTYTFQVDLASNPELVALIDAQHLLFAGDGFIINKMYFGGLETPAAPVDVDIDGKQWVFTWNALSATCVVDLGVTEPGVAILAYDMAAIDPDYAGIYFPYMIGTYTITKTDGTSGVVTITDLEYGDAIDIPYSNATETTVHFATMALLEEDIDCTLATTKIEISMESAEYLADGEYWIIANDKVATPLTSNYGYIQVANAIDGKSYAAHAFTFTQVEEGLYTIQDANGKYYYQTGSYNSFNVSATDGGTDEYLWEVYDTGNGQYAIINYETGKYIQLDSQYGTYGCYMEEKGTMPTLVLAEDPIAEPEPGDDAGEYATNVTCKTVSSAYVDGVATVNGVADVFTLKLGTSKLNGSATVTIPAGATEVSFYAVGWKNTNATLQFSVGGQVVGTQAIAANEGATGNAPYTMTVTDSDKYTLPLGGALAADTEVTVETTGSAYRAIIFGIQAK